MSAEKARIAVIYYSSTGNMHRLAEAVADGAADTGAEVRLRRVAELAPSAVVEANSVWQSHLDATAHIPEPTLDDLRWANGYALGTPTRFGNIAAQLRQFLDTTTDPWMAGELADKPATGFTGSYEDHGGQESTLLSLYNTLFHWGALVLPTGYVEYDLISRAGGNPYGVSQVEWRAAADEDYAKAVTDTARYQGDRKSVV